MGTILLLISVIIFMYYLSFKNRNKKLIFLIIILSISTFIIVTLSNINRPDAGLYHLPYISILQENKIIIGLTNLHYRFGHTSIFQYISATHNNYIFKKEFLNIPLASLMSFFIYFLFKNLQKFLKKNDEIKITSILFIFIFSLYSFNRYGNYGNDAPTNIFFLILIIYLLKIENFKTLKIEKFYQISILSIFLITLKPFMILVSILPLTLFFITSNKKKIIKNKNFITCLFLLSIWFIKNILISGCFVFPIKETCIKNLNIYNENITSTASNEAEAWAKGFPDSDKKLDFNTYNSKFNWVGAWYDNHFKKIVEKILPLIVLLTLFFIKNFFQKSFYRSLNLKNILENKKILFIMLFSFCYCIIWFIKFPVYRFGLSFIACFFILTFVCFLNLKNIQIYNKKFYLIITIFGLIGFYGKNLDRIIEKRNIIYNNYPWPKIYSMSDSEENLQKQFLKILDSKNNLVFYYSGGQECMYSKSPCSNYKNENLKIKRIYNYIIYYI